MDGSRWAERSDRPRSAVVVLVLVALLAAVAIASSGSTPGGSGGARRPAEWLLDVLLSLFTVAMALGIVVLVLLLLLRPALLADEDARKRRPRSQLALLLSLCMFVGLLSLASWRLGSPDGNGSDLGPVFDGDAAAAPGREGRYEPTFQTIPVIVTLALGAIALVAYARASRTRPRSLFPRPPDLSAALADAIDGTLDDLRAERDPRLAVIAAYARLERVLAAFGAPRHASEAPEEYLERVLVDLEVPRAAVSRLTALFARARFSHHDVAPQMKDEAIEALATVRDGLREARQRAAAEAERARAHARKAPA
jgi:hypothetical protein